MEEEKFCLECGEKIIGRADKKFCSDYCRNAFHNRQNKSVSNLIRTTNNRLKKNWRILQSLNTQGKTKVHKQSLEKAGFDFNLLTSIYTTQKKSVYYFVYDQGYLSLGNDFFMLVKKEV